MEWIMAWNTLYDVKFVLIKNKEPLMVMTILEATGLQRGCQAVATFPWGLCWLHFPKPRVRKELVSLYLGLVDL